jgi:hypothetical protein
MPAETCAGKTYRIEISGWDLDEKFFVEKTDLVWSEADKKVRLRHALRKGSLVFVRLLGASTPASDYPLAYEITSVIYQPEARFYETSLTQVHPRINADPAFVN